jgi:tRNA pseudouridine38-40 synthase
MNFKLTIQYDGTDFHGWQIQPGKRTVQGELTRALSLLEGNEVAVQGSGRTDAGVHAEGQVASVRLSRAFQPQKLRAAVNGNTDRDVRITEVAIVSDEFHARFSSRGKTYVYRTINDPVMSPFWRLYALHEARPLDVEAMRDASALFLGEHDWTAFSAAQSDVESRVRNVRQLDVSEVIDQRSRARLIEIRACGEGFLRYMVRSIAGSLLAVGRREIGERELSAAIKTGERFPAIVTAPAHGLTLVSVDYDGKDSKAITGVSG